MIDRWVLNASPLICLARAGYHELLIQIPEQAIVPEAVAEEVKSGPVGDPARSILAGGVFRIVPVPAVPRVVAWDLGPGETAVLSYALLNPGWQAVVDDRAARKCALALGIPVKGTLSIVLLAKKRGFVQSAAEVLRSLKTSGLWLDEKLIQQVLLEIAGEQW